MDKVAVAKSTLIFKSGSGKKYQNLPIFVMPNFEFCHCPRCPFYPMIFKNELSGGWQKVGSQENGTVRRGTGVE